MNCNKNKMQKIYFWRIFFQCSIFCWSAHVHENLLFSNLSQFSFVGFFKKFPHPFSRTIVPNTWYCRLTWMTLVLKEINDRVKYRIWLSLSCVPWFPGTVYSFVSMQNVICTLETSVHMTNLTRSTISSVPSLGRSTFLISYEMRKL